MAATSVGQPDFWQTLGNTVNRVAIEAAGGSVPGSSTALNKEIESERLKAQLQAIRQSSRSPEDKQKDIVSLFEQVGKAGSRKAWDDWKLLQAQLPTMLGAKQQLSDITTGSQTQVIGANSDARVRELETTGRNNIGQITAAGAQQKELLNTNASNTERLTRLILPELQRSRDSTLDYLNQQLQASSDVQRLQLAANQENNRDYLKTVRLATFISPIASLIAGLTA